MNVKGNKPFFFTKKENKLGGQNCTIEIWGAKIKEL
jgi:hypothetical protein